MEKIYLYKLDIMTKENEDKREVRVQGVSNHVRQELKNIADHLGVSRNDFIKLKYGEIINSYPEHMRQPKEKN